MKKILFMLLSILTLGVSVSFAQVPTAIDTMFKEKLVGFYNFKTNTSNAVVNSSQKVVSGTTVNGVGQNIKLVNSNSNDTFLYSFFFNFNGSGETEVISTNTYKIVTDNSKSFVKVIEVGKNDLNSSKGLKVGLNNMIYARFGNATLIVLNDSIVASFTSTFTKEDTLNFPNVDNLVYSENVNITSNFSDVISVLSDTNTYKSPVSGLSSINKLDNVNVYPNPSVGEINIDIKSNNYVVNVYDMKGQLQYQFLNQNKFTIDNPGIYILKVQSDEGFLTKKVIVQ